LRAAVSRPDGRWGIYSPHRMCLDFSLSIEPPGVCFCREGRRNGKPDFSGRQIVKDEAAGRYPVAAEVTSSRVGYGQRSEEGDLCPDSDWAPIGAGE
jgi:hypothetical protein